MIRNVPCARQNLNATIHIWLLPWKLWRKSPSRAKAAYTRVYFYRFGTNSSCGTPLRCPARCPPQRRNTHAGRPMFTSDKPIQNPHTRYMNMNPYRKRPNPSESPKGCPDLSNTTESTIESSKSDSTGVSWNISRISSSVPDLICHRAISRPGLSA